MPTESFQQKRMVQLSRQLDRQRQRNRQLVKQTHELAQKLKQKDQQAQIINQEMIAQKREINKLHEQIKQQNNAYKLIDLENQSLKQTNSNLQLENIRQRQKLSQLKEQMVKFQSIMKDNLFTKQKQLSIKQKDNFKLRQQNIEVEKLYLAQRQQLQKQKQAMFRALTKVKIDLDTLRKDLNANASYWEKNINSQRIRNDDEFKKVYKEISRIQAMIEQQKKLKKQIRQLKGHLEDVVAQNSQKIIQLYRYKNYV